MNRFYTKIANRAENLCEYCGAPEIAFNFPFEVEHIRPQAFGGETNLQNLALSCRACNIYKRDYLNGIDENGAKTERLFNPRIDVWYEHFFVDSKDFIIIGLSEIGKGTINRLRFNNSLQIQARKQWHRLGIFP